MSEFRMQSHASEYASNRLKVLDEYQENETRPGTDKGIELLDRMRKAWEEVLNDQDYDTFELEQFLTARTQQAHPINAVRLRPGVWSRLGRARGIALQGAATVIVELGGNRLRVMPNPELESDTVEIITLAGLERTYLGGTTPSERELYSTLRRNHLNPTEAADTMADTLKATNEKNTKTRSW